jgi:hypothetical protein
MMPITEAYISGYLECISRVKDIYTPNLGGFNCFFGFNKDQTIDSKGNLINLLNENKEYYSRNPNELDELISKIELSKILDWTNNIIPLIDKWTCDNLLEKENGKNGYYLSEYLVRLLKDFFNKTEVKLFKINPDWESWPWGDHMSEEYLFETADKMYILHFGESS